MLRIKHTTLNIPGKQSTTVLHPQTFSLLKLQLSTQDTEANTAY